MLLRCEHWDDCLFSQAVLLTVQEPAPTIGAPFSSKAKSFVDDCLLKDTTKVLQ